MTTHADVVADTLRRAGIRYVFGYPGGQNVRFIEALHGSGVQFVLVTHEASAGFMADVYGRLTGRPGVCLSTLGPGATNMTTGVGNAWLDRVPLLAFTGRMGQKWQGRTVQMQVDHQALYRPITKWSTTLTAGAVQETIARAIDIAIAEQPGPVHLDFPEDLAEEPSEESLGRPGAVLSGRARGATVDESALAHIERLIRTARYPLVAVGLSMNRAGVAATSALRRFLVANRLPVVSTMMAKGQVDDPSVDFVGVLGRARRDLVADFCQPADLVIAVGYDPVEFNYEEWVRADLPIVHIDTVRADLDDRHVLAAQLVGDLGAATERLAEISGVTHGWDLSALAAHRRRLYRALTPDWPSFSPHHVIEVLRRSLPDDGLITVDVGAHTHLIAQLWETRGPANLLVSNGWSSMGFAIPAAIGAKLVEPERPVVACTGDGGLLMMAGEISTAVRLRLPVVFLVFRDRFLSLIKVKQDRRQFHRDGVELFGPDLRFGDSLFGAPVRTVGDPRAMEEALRQALVADGPTVVDATVDPAEYDVVL